MGRDTGRPCVCFYTHERRPQRGITTAHAQWERGRTRRRELRMLSEPGAHVPTPGPACAALVRSQCRCPFRSGLRSAAMAPVSGSGRRGRGAPRGAPGRSRGRWRPQPENKDRGSAREGQGFALRRKQKIEQDYKKLLRKQSKVNRGQTIQYTENYPEHLKHLYLAEEEMLKQQQRPRKNEGHEKESQKVTEQKDNTVAKVSTTNQPRFKKKTANQKAREDYEKIKAERAKKKEEALKRKQEREEAQRLYKQRKMESYKILSKKTKKGQPNLNLQMEYLLQKIQQNT